MQHKLSVREIEKRDIEPLANYWNNAGDDFLVSMGVDLAKMPLHNQMKEMLGGQLSLSYRDKKAYCIIWNLNDIPVGHCNVNKIVFGKEASMHLHLWKHEARQKGMGTQLVKMTVPYFFKNLELETIYSEPYALNPVPHRTLEKAGFTFVKEYITTPGWINFEQPVKRWEMKRND